MQIPSPDPVPPIRTQFSDAGLRPPGPTEETGNGAGLKGCTVPVTQAAQLCLKDTDFRVIGGSGGTWKYDASSDTYSAYFDAPGWLRY